MSTVTRRMGLPTRADLFSPFFCLIWFFGLFSFGGGGNQSWPGALSNIWHTRQNFYHSTLARKDKETLTIRPSLWTVSKRRILISTPKRKIVLFSSYFCFFSFVFVSMGAREKQYRLYVFHTERINRLDTSLKIPEMKTVVHQISKKTNAKLKQYSKSICEYCLHLEEFKSSQGLNSVVTP
jgi:hypothetical protein